MPPNTATPPTATMRSSGSTAMSLSAAAWLPSGLNCCSDVAVSTPRRVLNVVSSAPSVVKRMSPKALSPLADDRPADHDPPVGLQCDRAHGSARRLELRIDLPVTAEGRIERPVGPVTRDRDEHALRAADVDVACDDEAPVGHHGESGGARLAGLERRGAFAAGAERGVQEAVGVEALDERGAAERPIHPGEQHRPEADDDGAVLGGAREPRRGGRPDWDSGRHQVVDGLAAACEVDDRRPVGPERAERRAMIGRCRRGAERARDKDRHEQGAGQVESCLPPDWGLAHDSLGPARWLRLAHTEAHLRGDCLVVAWIGRRDADRVPSAP